MEVEVLMKRMVELQQQEEECTQEEMVTRFERERSESIPTGTNPPVYRSVTPTLTQTTVVDSLLSLCCLFSGGAGCST